MNISKGEVSEFQYSSVVPIAKEYITETFSTADNSRTKILRVTDFKATSLASASVVISGEGGSFQDLKFTIPANTPLNFHWEMPYRLQAVSSTGTARGITASASVAGAKYSISGYFEV